MAGTRAARLAQLKHKSRPAGRNEHLIDLGRRQLNWPTQSGRKSMARRLTLMGAQMARRPARWPARRPNGKPDDGPIGPNGAHYSPSSCSKSAPCDRPINRRPISEMIDFQVRPPAAPERAPDANRIAQPPSLPPAPQATWPSRAETGSGCGRTMIDDPDWAGSRRLLDLSPPRGRTTRRFT